jgi:HPt (histidine-containing phosphotransfer) domain-containing protein
VQSAEPILDETVLAELMTSTGNDLAFVRDLVETYLAEAPAQVEGIAVAVAAADPAALVRPAHTLKSSSATMGAVRLSAIARRLEMAGRSGVLDGSVQADAVSVRVECEIASEALVAWLARETGA